MAEKTEKLAREVLPQPALSGVDRYQHLRMNAGGGCTGVQSESVASRVVVTNSETIIRLPAVKSAVGLSAATIYRLIKVGDFPPPIKLGKHASGWLQSAVQTWIRQRAGQGWVGDMKPQAN
jgi:prophage regulatory protein